MRRSTQWPFLAFTQASILAAANGCGRKDEGCADSVSGGESAKRNLRYYTPSDTYHPAFMLPTVLSSFRLSEEFGGNRDDLNRDTCITFNGQR